MNWALEVESITVAYREKPVLLDVSLKVPNGVLMAIVGPNGAGKSTLMKAILEIIKPINGKTLFKGESYKKQRKIIAYVPQSESVDWQFPTNVLDVVLMGTYGKLGLIKRPKKIHKKQSIEALKKAAMDDYLNRQISQLSGGQQQRVFIARSLVQDAEIYFLDEPFQGVDVKTEKAIIKILRELRSQGKTVIVVHHDLETVPEYFDWVTILNKELIACGPVDTIFTNENIEKAYKFKKEE